LNRNWLATFTRREIDKRARMAVRTRITTDVSSKRSARGPTIVARRPMVNVTAEVAGGKGDEWWVEVKTSGRRRNT
jgi:hypothetical protein